MFERFRATFELAAVGIAHVAPDGSWLEVNQRLCDIVGYTRGELLSRTFQDITYPPDLAADVGSMKKLLAGQLSTYNVEKRYVRKDRSTVWIDLNVSLVRDDTDRPQYFISLIQDISRRKEAEARLKVADDERARELAGRMLAERALHNTEEQLRQSQKMEAIGLLAGSIAHDFNNLLSVILGYSDMLVQDLPPSDPWTEEIGAIRDAAQSANQLTRQLLAFGRQQVLQPKAIDLNESISDMTRILGRMIGEDIELTVNLAPDLGAMFVDPNQVEQVLLNLVVNARDAMPRGGKLTIETSDTELDEAYAREHLDVTPGRYVMMSVRDTGPGMDHATQIRIFEPFFTTKQKGKGSGLGLSTVYGIVKQSGGSIWVHSELGQGTVFKVYFPRTEARPAPVSRRAPPPQRRGTETVLLVEDDAPVRALALSILRRQGYKALEAATGGDALLICEQFLGPIHLLLTDVVMPNMSGRQLWERLTTLRPEMRVLFMSGYTDDSVVRHGVLTSEFAFIQKPLMPGPLLSKLREVLEGPS